MNPDESPEIDENDSSVDEADIVQAPDHAPTLPDSMTSVENEYPDPWDPVWKIYLERNEKDGSNYRWSKVGFLSDEPFALWQTDPPKDMMLKRYGPGSYRFRVYLGGQSLRMDAYPMVGGQRSFNVANPDVTKPADVGTPAPVANAGAGTPPAAAPIPTSVAPGGTDVVELVKTLLSVTNGAGASAPAVAAATGLTVEQAAKLITTGDAVTELKAAVTLLKDWKTGADLERVKIEAANDKQLAELTSAHDRELAKVVADQKDLKRDLDALKKRDPIKDLMEQKRIAEAMGYTQDGFIGLGEKFLEIAGPRFFGGGNGNGSITATTGNENGNGNGQQQIGGTFPQQWRTADEGAWLNIGEWALWVGEKIAKRQPTSVELMVDEAISRTLNDTRGAGWLREASLTDLLQLFGMVLPPEQVKAMPDMKTEAASFLRLYSQRYSETEAKVTAYQNAKNAKTAPSAPAPSADDRARPITAAGRVVDREPKIPPPPPPPKV